MTTSNVDCNTNYVAASVASGLTVSGNSDRGGAFYIEDATAQTVVDTLTVTNCWPVHTGGAFTLINTKFKDSNSVYSYNGAE
jgi:hypothetical protein